MTKDADIQRELGGIATGIENLNRRYGDQEERLGRVEISIANIQTAFAGQPMQCLASMEEKFVTKEGIKPLENMYSTVKKAFIYIFCVVVTSAVAVVIYIRDRL